MPRTEEQNELIKEERSDDILASALRLFSYVGYKGVSVDLITEDVNCSHGLFYHYYDSKLDIFKKLIRESDKFDFKPFPIGEILDVDGFDGLSIMANYFGSEDVTNDAFLCYAKIFLNETDNKALAELLKRKYRLNSSTAVLAKLITKGQEDGKVIAGDPNVIAEAVRTFLIAYIDNLRSLKKKDRKPIDSKILLGFISCKTVK